MPRIREGLKKPALSHLIRVGVMKFTSSYLLYLYYRCYVVNLVKIGKVVLKEEDVNGRQSVGIGDPSDSEDLK